MTAGAPPGQGARSGRGRRPGNPDTRTLILRAAQQRFTRHGFDRTSLRAVARDAGVDPALVRHFFGDKTSLFLHAARIAFDPRGLLQRLVAGGRSGLGERILVLILPQWESPVGAGLVAAARHNPRIFEAFATVMGSAISEAADQVLADVPPAERAVRVALLESVIGGLFTTRYLVRMDPVASLPRRTIVHRWAPLLQAILDGDR